MENPLLPSDLFSHFAFEGTPQPPRALTLGHINDSYVVENTDTSAPWYLLQRINHTIFGDISALQNNIAKVTDHLRQKLRERGVVDLDRRVMRIVPTVDGQRYYRDAAGQVWRAFIYIRGAQCHQQLTPALAEQAGKAFGHFQQDLSDLEVTEVSESIPFFHDLGYRLEQWNQALENCALTERRARCEEARRFFESRADSMCLAEQLYRQQLLPKRINHCDTKVNNLLFDAEGQALCVVDLDTVMPGFVLSDFGDFIRTGANRGAEDEKDLSRVGLDIDIYQAYRKGYTEVATFLTPLEKELLPYGAKRLTYMQALRFLTDYLNGDTYYKIAHPDHNWQRAQAQIAYLEHLEQQI